MTPQAPWTKNCIRNEPRHTSPIEWDAAKMGITGSPSAAEKMMIRRRPKRSDAEPSRMPPIIAPRL